MEHTKGDLNCQVCSRGPSAEAQRVCINHGRRCGGIMHAHGREMVCDRCGARERGDFLAAFNRFKAEQVRHDAYVSR